MMLTVVVALVRLQYFAGDPIHLELKLTNAGADPIRIPHPGSPGSPALRLRIRGPRDSTDTLYGARTAAASPSYLELAPGQSWKGLLNVEDYAAISQPGDYQVTVELAAAPDAAISNAVTFRFSPLRVSGLSYGVWADPQESRAYLAWLADGGGGKMLAQASFIEGAGHDAGIEKQGPVPRRTVEPDATDPITQSTNYHPLHDLFQWIFWRRGNRLYGLSSFEAEPHSVELPAASVRVIGPALMDRSHTADILLAANRDPGEDRRRVWLARFQDWRTSTAPPRVEPLPFPAGGFSLATALDPAQGQDRRHIVGAAVEGSRLELVDLMVGRDGKPSAPVRRSVELEEPSAMLADGAPAIAINRRGTVRVAAVVCSAANTRRCRLIEAEFGERSADIMPIELPSKPIAARIAYSPVDSLRRAWAIWTEDGGVWGGRDAAFQKIAEGVPADAIRAVVSLARGDYLVEVSPSAGVVLEPF